MLIDIDLPIEPFNSYVRDGTAPQRIGKILEELKPEAVYFSEREGRRGGILVVDVASPSDVPRIAEPFFLVFNAAVRFHICMSPEDLGRAGLDEIGRKWS
jgi:hypothetical protein